MDSRTPFVAEVAKTIVENHGKGSDSFIFGISGKWGEGKTRFLNDLRKKLKDDDSSFEIFDINPWKFSVDRISFLRNFLRTLYAKGDPGKEKELKELDVDTSESAIHWPRFACFFIVIVAICWAFTWGPLFAFVTGLSASWKFGLLVVIIPIFLAIVQGVTTVQKSNHAIVTMDRFDDLLGDILDQLRFKKKKVVIFVDDLDRVTPGMARDVLDNLRTFFDKPAITFVVTGDHTVLEGYLGRDLLPNDSNAAQLEEGRRFLKKIFNVYWRLPLPIKNDVDVFIKDEFGKRATALDAIFSEERKNVFAGYLSKYFESNFREIIRFLDTTLFTFQVINQKAGDSDGQKAAYFKEMLANPLLVVRILMIQELCTPLFEKMTSDVEILRSLEYAVEKKNASKISEVLDQSKDILSPGQRGFIEKFIYKPRFFKESSLQVSDLRPFLSLAADGSFGDQRGPSSEDFVSIVTVAGDPAQVRNGLLSMGKAKAEEGATAIVAQLPGLPEPTKTNALKTLLVALSDMPAEHPAHKIFGEKFASLDYAFVNSAPSGPKMEILNIFWRWLDVVNDEGILNRYKEKFPFSDIAQFNAIDMENAGLFRSYMVTNWLKIYYLQQDKPNAISAMVAHFGKLKKEKVIEEIETMKQQLIDDLLQDSTTLTRENRFVIVENYTSDGRALLKAAVLQRVFELNPDITAWGIAKTSGENPPWTTADIEAKILEKIKAVSDFGSLNQTLRFAMSNKIGTPETVWPAMWPEHKGMIVDSVPQIIDDAYYQPIAPPEAYASQLMDAVVDKIKKDDLGQQIQWLNYAVKGKWPWVSLGKYPLENKLDGFPNAENEQIKQVLEVALAGWEDGKYICSWCSEFYELSVNVTSPKSDPVA